MMMEKNQRKQTRKLKKKRSYNMTFHKKAEWYKLDSLTSFTPSGVHFSHSQCNVCNAGNIPTTSWDTETP